jgi:hypothetical protein
METNALGNGGREDNDCLYGVAKTPGSGVCGVRSRRQVSSVGQSR